MESFGLARIRRQLSWHHGHFVRSVFERDTSPAHNTLVRAIYTMTRSFTALLICLVLWTRTPQSTAAFRAPLGTSSGSCRVPFYTPRMKLSRGGDSDNDDDEPLLEGPIFYDDFADQAEYLNGISSSHDSVSMSSSSSPSNTTTTSTASSTTPNTSLQDRLVSLRQQEDEQRDAIQQNWKLGHWTVRGVSLDPWGAVDNNDDTTTPTHISVVTSASSDDHDADGTSPRVWVGRTDGSLLLVQLGTEHWTKFQSQLTVSSQDVAAFDNTNDNNDETNTILRVSNQLRRTDPVDSSVANEEDGDENAAEPLSEPFDILWQHAPSLGSSDSSTAGTITHILPVGQSRLFTCAQGSGGSIQQWSIHQSDDDNEDEVTTATATHLLQGAHTSNLICLASVSNGRLIVSVSSDGSLALWKRKHGTLVYRCDSILDNANDNARVTSATTDDKHVFVGTSLGSVIVFAVSDLLATSDESPPVPCGSWMDNKDAIAVTAIACAGPGTMGRASNQATFVLLTGTQVGDIKQWEVMSRTLQDGKIKLEQWPKLATQRLPNKAHVFRGHDGAVTALRGVDGTKFVSAASDGTIRAWSPATGKELFRMSGFSEDIHHLCLEADLLITNGMKQYVCVHDFNASTEGNDFELEMPEYEE